MPVHVGGPVLFPNETRQVDRTQVARFVWQQGDLATRVGCLDATERGGWIGAGDRIQKDQPWIPGLPSRFTDVIEEVACSHPTRDPPTRRVVQVIRPVTFDRVHEG